MLRQSFKYLRNIQNVLRRTKRESVFCRGFDVSVWENYIHVDAVRDVF